MSERLRVGFIGCGLIARSHARGLARLPGAEIGPVYDTDGNRAADFARSTGSPAVAVSSQGEVITGADAIYICTWTSAHPQAVHALAAAGKPVFCEKPLAVDLDAVEAMTEAVTSAGVVNQVGLILRHSPAFRWLAAQLGRQTSGPVMSVVFRNDQYLPTQGLYNSTWRADRTKAGAGTLLEHSIHDLDLLRWMLGPISTVSAVTATVHGLDGIDDQASVLLTATSGATATLTSIWHDVLSRPSQRRVEVFCQRAVLTLSGDWSGPVEVEDPSGAIERLEGERLAKAAAECDGLGTNPDADFVTAVRSGRSAYPDFVVATDAHRLADAAYRSAAEGGTVTSL